MEKRLILNVGILLGLIFPASAQICPIKISNRLCPTYSSAENSTLLKVRVMLDPALWSPSKPEDNNPLVAAAREMFNKYEFKTIENPDSAYRPSFLKGSSPSILEVLYHNVLMPRMLIDSVTKESYIKEIQLGCRITVSTGLCDTLNISFDTGWVRVFLYFQRYIENDTVAMTTYLAKYDTRNPENIEDKLNPESIVKYPIRGMAISRSEFEKMSSDPEVLQLTNWYKITTRISHTHQRDNFKFKPNQSVYSVNGKKLEMQLKHDRYRIFRGK